MTHYVLIGTQTGRKVSTLTEVSIAEVTLETRFIHFLECFILFGVTGVCKGESRVHRGQVVSSPQGHADTVTLLAPRVTSVEERWSTMRNPGVHFD